MYVMNLNGDVKMKSEKDELELFDSLVRFIVLTSITCGIISILMFMVLP